jgi:hypothetical protein
MARGSGFVFQQVHNVMADVPPENVVAMLRAASRLRDGRRGESPRGVGTKSA